MTVCALVLPFLQVAEGLPLPDTVPPRAAQAVHQSWQGDQGRAPAGRPDAGNAPWVGEGGVRLCWQTLPCTVAVAVVIDTVVVAVILAIAVVIVVVTSSSSPPPPPPP